MGVLSRLFRGSKTAGGSAPDVARVKAAIEQYAGMIRELHPSIDRFVRDELMPTISDGALLELAHGKFEQAVEDDRPHSVGAGDDEGVFYSVSAFPGDLQQARKWYKREFEGYVPYLDNVLQGVSRQMRLEVLCHIAIGRDGGEAWSQVSVLPVAKDRGLPVLFATDLLAPGETLPGA